MARADLLLDLARLAFATSVALYALGTIAVAAYMITLRKAPSVIVWPWVAATWFALLGSIAWLMAVPSV
jgi:hypothetical protein